jgi:hypothetical protein
MGRKKTSLRMLKTVCLMEKISCRAKVNLNLSIMNSQRRKRSGSLMKHLNRTPLLEKQNPMPLPQSNQHFMRRSLLRAPRVLSKSRGWMSRNKYLRRLKMNSNQLTVSPLLQRKIIMSQGINPCLW